MTIPDEAVEAARQALHRVRWERMKRMIEGDRRAMGEREPGDPPDMQEDARAALEAAAPHLYPASGEVGAEIVRHMTHEEWRGCRIESYRWKSKIPEALQGSEWDWSYASHWSTPGAHEEAEALVSVKDAERALLSALSEATERAGRMERERDEERERAERAEGERDDAIARWCIRMADVREASGIGVKPMLDEVPGAIKERIDAIEAKTKRTETLIAKARTLSDTLKAYGYPVSAAHWANASGQMSVQARALHLAAEGLIEGLAALRWTEEASQGEGE